MRWKGIFTMDLCSQTHHFDVGLRERLSELRAVLWEIVTLNIDVDRGLKVLQPDGRCLTSPG